MKLYKKPPGFTLIELLLIVAIIGLLMAIAIPTYQDQIRKARRAKAIAALMNIAAQQEAYFTQHQVYATDLDTLGIPNEIYVNNEPIYQLSIELLEDATSGYVANATPQGDQAKDRCGALSLDSLGRKSDALDGQCWP